MRSAVGLNRHILVQSRFWTYPAAVTCLERWVSSVTIAEVLRQGRRPAMDSSTFARVLHVFKVSRGHSTIADVSIQSKVA